jgi:hypothetical protein
MNLAQAPLYLLLSPLACVRIAPLDRPDEPFLIPCHQFEVGIRQPIPPGFDLLAQAWPLLGEPLRCVESVLRWSLSGFHSMFSYAVAFLEGGLLLQRTDRPGRARPRLGFDDDEVLNKRGIIGLNSHTDIPSACWAIDLRNSSRDTPFSLTHLEGLSFEVDTWPRPAAWKATTD